MNDSHKGKHIFTSLYTHFTAFAFGVLGTTLIPAKLIFVWECYAMFYWDLKECHVFGVLFGINNDIYIYIMMDRDKLLHLHFAAM